MNLGPFDNRLYEEGMIEVNCPNLAPPSTKTNPRNTFVPGDLFFIK
jgi:hypothetical protein